ncbi:hypothetical protein Mp_Vg00600 [Marchantia polymorpha subsp. ruderalis]|uniref:PAS domain-containing protein n=1 Tax=Marchantia polymorpha TaxID=3197 RepID=A0A2R6VX84_MARPO|nr:hypothetical protein MARPO_YA0056 [Marchantia polymorpha]BBN20552.1 hypothetical protein Mp_Vg00600 [Marchantia polymorpha subsp. ruderalis]|eukprot:PTQ26207.1 hypothetical protein MARPO_YA0056 [Marchantia polymorpha]
MPQNKKPPTGAASKAYSVHQPNIFSREVQLSRNTRGSLEIFGGGPQTSSLLFSRTRSAWKDALHCAEPVSEGSVSCNKDTIRPTLAEASSSPKIPTVSLTEDLMDGGPIDNLAVDSREDDVSKWLADAGKSVESPKSSMSYQARLSDCLGEDSEFSDSYMRSVVSIMSDSSVAPDRSVRDLEWDGVLPTQMETNVTRTPDWSNEVVSQRAVQWGYGVVLKPTLSRGSGSAETERISRLSWTTGASDASSGMGTSSRTTSEGSSGESTFSSIIPGVSRNVKEALTSFQLAFVVCDALNPEYPVLYASAGFFSMTGYTAKEVVGRNWMQAEVTENGRTSSSMNEEPISAYASRISSAELRDGSLDISGSPLPSVKHGSATVCHPSCPSAREFDFDSPAVNRYSLSSSRHSMDARSKSISSQKSVRVSAENFASSPGIAPRVNIIDVEEPSVRSECGSIDTSKSGKRTSGIIRLFKKLNGKFSSPKGGLRDKNDGLLNSTKVFVDEVFNFDDEESETDDVERKERRSGIDFNTSSFTQSDGMCRGRGSSQSRTSPDKQPACGKSGDTAGIRGQNDLHLGIEQHCDFHTSQKPVQGNRRLALGTGRRSAQHVTTEGRLNELKVYTMEKDRRHSVASMPSSGTDVNVNGKSQFCIVHQKSPS